MRLVNQIVLASTNRHKLEECRAILKPLSSLELVPASALIRNTRSLGLSETFSTYAENALAKARLVNRGSHYPALGDDSGLEVRALEGRPGVKSHRFAPPRPGITQDQANIELLLAELKSQAGKKGGEPDRVARFVCVVGLVLEGISITAEGVLNGTLIDQPRGQGGFGYDPIFVPDGHTKTLSELSSDEKNRISHRAQALAALLRKAEEHGLSFVKP